jgi:hypothetical protein
VIGPRLAVAAAALLAAAPAEAYRRSCQGDVCFAWPERSVTWVVNASRPFSSPSCGGSDAVIAAAQAAFAAWEGAARAGEAARCAHIAFPYGGSSSATATGLGSPAEHLVVFRQGWCSENAAARADPCFTQGSCRAKFNCFDDSGSLDQSVLALTRVTFNGRGEITDADIELVDWDGTAGEIAGGAPPDGWYWTCADPDPPNTVVCENAQTSGESCCATLGGCCTAYGQGDCLYEDLQNTLTHEAGHFLGLAHPCGSGTGTACTPELRPVTMYPTASPRETKKRTLDADDVEGACAVYMGAPEEESGCGCGGSAGAGGVVLAILSLAGLAPRARRRG